MCRILLLLTVSITLISIASSYVPIKGGRHAIKPKEDHNEKHDEVVYPLIIENKDLTPEAKTESMGNAQIDDVFKSVLDDTNQSAVQENNRKSTTLNGNEQKELEVNESKNDSSVSHTENHHMKNGNEERRVYKEVKENFHHDQVTIRNQVTYTSGANFGHKTHDENEHKVSINQDQHKVSMSNEDGKNVEHNHNEHFLHISNKDNPSHYHIHQHTSVDNVKIDSEQKVSRNHHNEKVDIEVPFVSGTVQEKVDQSKFEQGNEGTQGVTIQKQDVGNTGEGLLNIFQNSGQQNSESAVDQNTHVKVPDLKHQTTTGVTGFESSVVNKDEQHSHKHESGHKNDHHIGGGEHGVNLHDHKHVSTEVSQHDGKTTYNSHNDKEIKIHEGTKHVDESHLFNINSNKDKAFIDGASGTSSKDSVDEKFNSQHPLHGNHHEKDVNHHVPFGHPHPGFFEGHHIEHHYSKFHDHHHNDHKHVSTEAKQHNLHNHDGKSTYDSHSDKEIKVHEGAKHGDESHLFHSNSNKDKTFFDGASGTSNKDSVDKKFNSQHPGHGYHHEKDVNYHVPFGHAHPGFFEGHHHQHNGHFYNSDESDDSSGECDGDHEKFNHHPYHHHHGHHHDHHQHYSHHHHNPHDSEDFHHSKHHVKGGPIIY